DIKAMEDALSQVRLHEIKVGERTMKVPVFENASLRLPLLQITKEMLNGVLEERLRQEAEEAARAVEQRRQEEEAIREEQERRLHEEEQRLAEERRQEEQRRLEEEQRRLEELAQIEKEKQEQELRSDMEVFVDLS